MDDLCEISIKNVCCTCLSTERNLSQLCRIDDGVNNLFFLLSYKSEAYQAMFVKDVTDLFICWECRAIIQRLVRFREQACVAQTKLTDIADGKISYSKLKCLSKLSYSRQTVYNREAGIKEVTLKNFVDCGTEIVNTKVETLSDSEEIPLAQLCCLKRGGPKKSQGAAGSRRRKTEPVEVQARDLCPAVDVYRLTKNEEGKHKDISTFTEVAIDNNEVDDDYDDNVMSDEDTIDSSILKKSNNDKTTIKNKDTTTPIIKYRNNVISSSINISEKLVDSFDIEKSKNLKRRHSLVDINDDKETDHEIAVKSEIEKAKSKRKVENKNMKAYNVNKAISSDRNKKFNEKQKLDDRNIVSFMTKKSQSKKNQVRNRDLEPLVSHKKIANDKSYESFNKIQMTRGEMVESIEMRKSEDDYDELEDNLLYRKRRQEPQYGAKLKVLIDDPKGAGFACVECNKYFKKRKALDKHVQRSHKDGYQCPFCGKRFASRAVLRKHELKHSKREECSVCGKMVRADFVAAHAKTHTEGEYACVECDKKFMSRIIYENHLKYARSHANREGLENKCPVCGKDHRSPGLLRDHYNFVHMGKTLHKCPICDKALATRRSVTMHIRRTHSDVEEKVRDRICLTCGKGFTSLRDLKQHELIHTGERPLTCDMCARSFRQKGALYIHKRVVHKVALKKKPVHTDEIIVPNSEINKSSD